MLTFTSKGLHVAQWFKSAVILEISVFMRFCMANGQAVPVQFRLGKISATVGNHIDSISNSLRSVLRENNIRVFSRDAIKI